MDLVEVVGDKGMEALSLAAPQQSESTYGFSCAQVLRVNDSGKFVHGSFVWYVYHEPSRQGTVRVSMVGYDTQVLPVRTTKSEVNAASGNYEEVEIESNGEEKVDLLVNEQGFMIYRVTSGSGGELRTQSGEGPEAGGLYDLNSVSGGRGPYILGKSGEQYGVWSYNGGQYDFVGIEGCTALGSGNVTGRQISNELVVPFGNKIWKGNKRKWEEQNQAEGKTYTTVEITGSNANWQNIHVSLVSPRHSLLVGTANNKNGQLHSVLLVPVDITVKKKGENTTPENGLVVKKGDILEFAFAPQFLKTTKQFGNIITWQWRHLKGNGEYTEWENISTQANGTKFEHTTNKSGIFQIKAVITNSGEYLYKRKKDEKLENFKYGSGKKNQPDCIGVCDTQIQIDICREAQTFYGSEAYAGWNALPAQYGFPAYSTSENSVIRCNIFVAHRATAAGAVVPKINGFFNEYPPLATYPQPGWIIAHPNPGDAGPCAITDYDGEGVGAGSDSGKVNKNYDFWDGTSRLRKYNP
jgi:hypothetical protein